MFSLDITIPVHWHVSTGISTRITSYHSQNTCENVTIFTNYNDYSGNVTIFTIYNDYSENVTIFTIYNDYSERLVLWAFFSRCVRWENSYSISFQIKWDMIMVTVFLSILNQMEFHLVQKSKGELSPRSFPIQCERKWNSSFLSVGACRVSMLHSRGEIIQTFKTMIANVRMKVIRWEK